MSFLENIKRDDVEKNILLVIRGFRKFRIQSDVSPYGDGISGNSAFFNLAPGERPLGFFDPRLTAPLDVRLQIGGGVSFVEGGTNNLPNNRWSWDRIENKVNLRLGGDPLDPEILPPPIHLEELSSFAFTTYPNMALLSEFHFSLKPISWHHEPKNESSEVVPYLPLITGEISSSQSFKQSRIGIAPIQVDTINLAVSDNPLLQFILRGSLAARSVISSLYFLAGDSTIENIQEMSEFPISAMRLNLDSIVISASPDRSLDKGMGLVASQPTYSHPDLWDLVGSNGFVNRTQIYFGTIRGHKLAPFTDIFGGTNDYPTRTWYLWTRSQLLGSWQTYLQSIATWSPGPLDLSSDRMRIIGPNLRRILDIGFRVVVTQGANTAYPLIAAGIDDDTMEFDAALPAAFNTSSTVTVSWRNPFRVWLVQDGVGFELMPNRDYVTGGSLPEGGPASGHIGLQITSDGVSNVGADPSKMTWAKILAGEVFVVCDFVGITNDSFRLSWAGETFGDLDFDENNGFFHRHTPCNANPAMVLYAILTGEFMLGFPKSTLNEKSFTDAYQALDRENAAPVYVNPHKELTGLPLPNGREVIQNLLVTFRIRLFKDIENKWKIYVLSLPHKRIVTITDDDIIDNYQYEHDYFSVVESVDARYSRRDFERNGEARVPNHIPLLEPSGGQAGGNESISNRRFSYDVAITPHWDIISSPSDPVNALPPDTAPRRSYWHVLKLYRERQGVFKIRVSTQFYDIDFDDQVNLKLKKLPGFPEDLPEPAEVETSVVSIKRGLSFIELELEDKIPEETTRDLLKFI